MTPDYSEIADKVMEDIMDIKAQIAIGKVNPEDISSPIAQALKDMREATLEEICKLDELSCLYKDECDPTLIQPCRRCRQRFIIRGLK